MGKEVPTAAKSRSGPYVPSSAWSCYAMYTQKLNLMTDSFGLWDCEFVSRQNLHPCHQWIPFRRKMNSRSYRNAWDANLVSCPCMLNVLTYYDCAIGTFEFTLTYICKVLGVNLWQPLQGVVTRVLSLRILRGKNPFVLLHRPSQLQWNPLRRSGLKLMNQGVRNRWWLNWIMLLLKVSLGYIELSSCSTWNAKCLKHHPAQYGLHRSTQAAVKAETTSPSRSAAPGACQTA